MNNPLYFVLHPTKSFDLPVSLAHKQIIAITKQKIKARLCKIANYIYKIMIIVKETYDNAKASRIRATTKFKYT